MYSRGTGFFLSAFLAAPLALAAPLPYVHPEIVSAWVASDGNSVMIFRHDGIYYHAQGTSAQAGFERGSFAWNKTSGAFTATQTVDTNGTAGLSHPSGAIAIAISGDTLTRTIGSTATTFTRVTNTAGSIVGAWFEPGYPGAIVFLGNGSYYYIGEDDDVPDQYDGMERGTYTWNSGTKILTATATLETEGDGGLGSLPAGLTATVTGNSLSIVDPGDDPDVFYRLTTNTSPLRLPDFEVMKVAEYIQTTASGPVLVPLNAANEDYPYQGEVNISPAIPATTPTLKIGGRSATPFDVDEDDGSFFLEYGYGSKALLDAASAFPDNTNYVFANGSGSSATVNFPSGGTYPVTPGFIESTDEDDEGEWQAGIYQMDAQTLRWTPHTGYNAATHLTAIEVQDVETEETIVDQVLQGDVSVYELGGKLRPGHTYEVVISQVKIGGSATAGTGIFSGKQGYALYIAANEFNIGVPGSSGSPSILQNPQSVEMQTGGKTTLTVGVERRDEATLQWFKNGVAIPGQTGNSLTFLSLAQSDYADYTVKVYVGSSVITSEPATILPPKPFDTYITGIGLDRETTGAPDADYDGDGYVNLLEWVIGGDPKVAQPNLLPAFTSTPNGSGRNLIFKYNRRLTAADTIQVVEHSATLSPPWIPASHGQAGVTMTTAASPLGALFEQVTLNIPVTGPKNFARLRVGPEIVINPETSYRNFKEIGLTPQLLPTSLAFANARGYGDFFNDGTVGLFGASLTYVPGEAATEAVFGFWRKQPDGTYASVPGMISGNSGCIHPRKALVADFNGDHRPDVFVICHGYDAPPYPGERNRILLSQPNGTYVVQDAATDVSFFHGGSAMDVDRDGDVDVVAVRGDRGRQSVFLNQGNGTFSRELPGRLPEGMSSKNYFSVELMDVNEDGKPDLVAGGHEWEGAPTVVYLNPGNSDFSPVTPITIPAVPAEGVVLDFLTTGTGASRALWVLRSSGGDGTFYQSRTLQKVAWPSLTSTVPLKTRPLQWVDWMIPGISGGQPVITSDHAARGLSIPQ